MDPITALQLEVVVVAAFAIVAVMVLASIRPDRRRLAWLIGALVLAGSVGLAASTANRTGDRAILRMAVLEELPRIGRPNDGFVGSDACLACHPGEHASWHGSWHRTMTQVVSPETALGDFDGVTLSNRGRDVQLQRRGESYHAITVDPDWELEQYAAGVDPDSIANPPMVDARVVMSTGANVYQSYWIPSRAGNRLVNFHWAWINETEEWIPREAAFLRPPDSPRLHQIWNNQCIYCHSTDGVEGYARTVGGGVGFDTSVAALGISCEACHGPGDEHVALNRNPIRRARYQLDDGAHDPTMVNPQRIDSGRSRAACAQCHSVSMPTVASVQAGRRFRAGDELGETRVLIRGAESRYETEAERAAWRAARDYLESEEPGYFAARFWSDGTVRTTGVDHSAMIESPCAVDPAFTCLSCHSMHDYVAPEDQLRPGMDGDAACIQRHTDIGADSIVHSRHAPGPGAPSCLDCHMPKTVYGLLKAVRTHEVSSPDARVAQATGRPDACSLCHVDRTLEWTARELEAGWGVAPPDELSPIEREFAAAIRWGIAGDAAQRALIADHLGDAPVRATAGTATWAAPLLAHLMNDPYDAVRYVAARSYRELTGDALEDWRLMAPPAAREQAVARRFEALTRDPIDAVARLAWPEAGDLAAILRTPGGVFDRAAFARAVAQRDDRPIELRE
jgi:hypothetical protein